MVPFLLANTHNKQYTVHLKFTNVVATDIKKKADICILSLARDALCEQLKQSPQTK